jgi:hypothetical protein
MAKRFNRSAHNGRFDGGSGDGALGRALVSVLMADFARHGARRIKTLRRKQPHDYLRFVASLPPTASGAGAAGPSPPMSEDEFATALEIIRTAAAQHDKARSKR